MGKKKDSSNSAKSGKSERKNRSQKKAFDAERHNVASKAAEANRIRYNRK